MEGSEDEKLTKLAVNNFLIKNKHAAIKGKKFVIDKLVHNVKKLQQRVSKVGDGGGDAAAFQRKEKRMTEELQILKTLRPENILKFGILNKKTFQKVSSVPDPNIKEVALCRLVENPSIKKVIEEFRRSFPNYEERVRVMFQTMGLQKIKHRKQRISKIKRMGTLDQYLAKERQNVEILEELLGIDVNSGILQRRTSSAYKAFQEERGSGKMLEEERGTGRKMEEERGKKKGKEESSGDSFFITSIFKNAEEESEDGGSDGYESGTDGGEYDDGESDDEGSEFENDENEVDLSAIENRTKNKGGGNNVNTKDKNIHNGNKNDSLNNNKNVGNSLNKKGNDGRKDRESNPSSDLPQKRKLPQKSDAQDSNPTQKKQKLDQNNVGTPQPNQTPRESKPNNNVKVPQAKQKPPTKKEAKKKNNQKKKQAQKLMKAAPTEEVRVVKLSEAGEGTLGPLKAQKIDSDSEAEEDFFIRDPSKQKKKAAEERSDEEDREEDFIDIDTSIYFRRNLYRGNGLEEADDGPVSGRGRGSRGGRGGRGRGSFRDIQWSGDDNFSRQRGRGRDDWRGRGRGRGDERGRGRGEGRGRGREDGRGGGRGGRGEDRGGRGEDRGRGRGRGDGPKGPGDGPLHPSWEAKIKQNTQHISKFEGKKIVFD